MIFWKTNEDGTLHRANSKIRGSRYLRDAHVTVCDGQSKWKVALYAVLDMTNPVNHDDQGRQKSSTYTCEERWFNDLNEAKTWAESWLEPPGLRIVPRGVNLW